MADELESAITEDREVHGKKPLKPKNSDQTKNKKQSKNDPEAGWFHKGEHKQVFAFNVQSACDAHGWILGDSVHAGNTHDTQAFPVLYSQVEKFNPSYIVADAGYNTPTIANFLLKFDLSI